MGHPLHLKSNNVHKNLITNQILELNGLSVIQSVPFLSQDRKTSGNIGSSYHLKYACLVFLLFCD